MSKRITLATVQAENGLRSELWRVALDEAYAAKDAARQMAALQGLTRDEIVERYLTAHPALRPWAEQHIVAGTCEKAIAELHATLAETRQRRLAMKQELARRLKGARKPAEEHVEFVGEWMKEFMSGPAEWPSEEAPPALPKLIKPIADAALAKFLARPEIMAMARTAMRAAAAEHFGHPIPERQFRAACKRWPARKGRRRKS